MKREDFKPGVRFTCKAIYDCLISLEVLAVLDNGDLTLTRPGVLVNAEIKRNKIRVYTTVFGFPTLFSRWVNLSELKPAE